MLEKDAVINITLPNEISNELVSVTIDGEIIYCTYQ